MSWKRDKRIKRHREIRLSLAIAHSLQEKIGPRKPSISIKDLTLKGKRVDPSLRAPALTEQDIQNKMEKARRNKKPVTLPSFKCLENMED